MRRAGGRALQVNTARLCVSGAHPSTEPKLFRNETCSLSFFPPTEGNFHPRGQFTPTLGEQGLPPYACQSCPISRELGDREERVKATRTQTHHEQLILCTRTAALIHHLRRARMLPKPEASAATSKRLFVGWSVIHNMSYWGPNTCEMRNLCCLSCSQSGRGLAGTRNLRFRFKSQSLTDSESNRNHSALWVVVKIKCSNVERMSLSV